MSVCAKFEICAEKTEGEVVFLRETGFSKKSLLPNFGTQLQIWWQICPEIIYDATLQVW